MPSRGVVWVWLCAVSTTPPLLRLQKKPHKYGTRHASFDLVVMVYEDVQGTCAGLGKMLSPSSSSIEYKTTHTDHEDRILPAQHIPSVNP
jgi:hypothetical protein